MPGRFGAGLLAASKAEATLQHSKDPLECESEAFAFGPRKSYAEVFHWPDQHICQAFRGRLLAASKAEATLQHSKDILECESKLSLWAASLVYRCVPLADQNVPERFEANC